MTAGLLPLMVRLRFLFLDDLKSQRPTSLAMALAVSDLKMGDMIGLAFFESGGLLELISREAPKSLSCALKELLGLSSCCCNKSASSQR